MVAVFFPLYFPAAATSFPQVQNQIIPMNSLTHLSLRQWLGLIVTIATTFICCIRFPTTARRNSTAWPLLGMIAPLLLNLHRVQDWFTELLIDSGGTFLFVNTCLGRNGVVTCHPANAEYILRTRFSNFQKGVKFHRIFRELLGDGIFNADNELWDLQRTAISSHFRSRAQREFALQTVQQLVEERLLPILKSKSEIDLQDLLLRFTVDNICLFGLGYDPGSLLPNLPIVPFAKAFDIVAEACTSRFTLPVPIWQLMKIVGMGKQRQLSAALATLERFASEVISSKKTSHSAQSLDMLSCFMQMRDSRGQPYSGKFLRDFTFNLLLAGRDTSSLGLAWFFWLLSKHPEVENSILKEISRITEKRIINPTCPTFTMAELKEMHYLHAALSESLRLYPPVPIEIKDCVDGDVLPTGIKVEKGARVVLSLYAMGRMESVWGKDCMEFRPERWLRDGMFTQESPFKYPVFNAGPRLCLGKEIAYMQMKSVAASILKMFKVRVLQQSQVAQKLSATLYMKHGLLVKVSEREEVD